MRKVRRRSSSASNGLLRLVWAGIELTVIIGIVIIGTTLIGAAIVHQYWDYVNK